MPTHEQLYRSIGVRTLGHFANPVTILGSEFVFPKGSEVYFYKPADIIVPISKDIGYMKNIKTPIIFTRTNYATSVGRFAPKMSTLSRVLASLKQKEPGFKYVRPENDKYRVASTDLPIYAYNVINALHTYRPDPLQTYQKWYNSFNAMIRDIKANVGVNERHKYVVIDMPSNIPDFATCERMVGRKMSVAVLKYFQTIKHLTFLEFWKFLTPEYIEETAFFRFKPSEMENITFIFAVNDNVTLLNLATLMQAVREYSPKGKITKTDSVIVRKLFMLFIVKALRSESKTMLEATRIDRFDKKSNPDTYDEEDVDVAMIDDELDDYTTGESEEKELEKLADDELKQTNTDEIINAVDDENEDSETIAATSKEYKTHDSVVAINKKRIEALHAGGVMTKKASEDISYALSNQKNKPSPYGEKKTLGEMLIVTEEDTRLDVELSKLPETRSNPNRNSENDTVKAFDTGYVKKLYKKHTLQTLYSLQSSGVVIKSHDITKEDSALGGVETHTFELAPLGGRPSKHVIKLPVIEEDGTFVISGNRYTMRKQRTDVPIRKIRPTRVALTSFYGKLFIDKAALKKDDIGFWFSKQLTASGKASNIVFMSSSAMDASVPRLYSMVSRYTTMFIVGSEEYKFIYDTRKNMVRSGDSLGIIEKNGKYVLVATKPGGYVVMRNDGSLLNSIGGKFTEHESLFDTTGVGYGFPIEHASVKIFKQRIPVGLLLAYYYGLSKLLKMTNAKYTIVDRTKRYPLSENDYVITFQDKKIIMDKSDYKNTLIFGGLSVMNKNTRDLEMVVFDNRDTFIAALNSFGLQPIYMTEFKMLDTMFVDPMTRDVLAAMKEPTTLRGLLFRAIEMLEDDNYKNPTSADGMLIKGFERIPGMVYKTLANSLRTYENKNTFGKSRMEINPFEVWKTVNNDSTCALVDDLNPLIHLKQKEEVTYLGQGGRSKDTMSKQTRVFTPSETGIISEATKDSADVGITASLSANPRIMNLLGMVEPAKENEKLDISNILSTSAMLAPGAMGDDPKRVNFISIQNSHTVPVKDMKSSGVRTGYESVLPYRVDEKFCYNAAEDGVVINLTPRIIEIQYASGAKKKINLTEWSSKEEAGISYIHKVGTLLKKGDKFKAGWNITYDTGFFEQDIFDKHRVVFRQGTTLRTVLMEVPDSYEDSHAISAKVDKKLKTTVAKVKSYIINADDNIVNIVKSGDKVKPSDPVFTIVGGGDVAMMDAQFDKESLAILENIKRQTPKAGVSGTVNKVRVFYNIGQDGDYPVSKNMKELIDVHDKIFAKDENKPNLTGKVDSTYSIKGKPLLPGEVEIKIYIETDVSMGVGDKAVFANQLKTTVGDVITREFKTDDGVDIDAVFSTISIDARIVTSPGIIGLTNTLLNKVGEKAVESYFNE